MDHHDTIYSASWDHSVRKWDVETGKDFSDIDRSKVIIIDADGSRFKGIARSLRNLGVK
ncbi:hypothetical protein J1N35_004756, partial [Gossypium stocksii]